MDTALVGELISRAGYPLAGEAGIAVALRVPGGDLVAADGQASAGTAFGADTVSYCGSTAKQVTAACAAALVIGGRLDPQAPIGRWLPEFPPWASRLRVQHLIHHTSGLPGHQEFWDWVVERGDLRWDNPTALAFLAGAPRLQFEPGHRHEYSSLGYITLATVLERICGVSFPLLAAELVLGPAGMDRSVFCATAQAVPAGAAIGHPPAGAGEPRMAFSVGDGGLWSTAAQLGKLNDFFLPGGALPGPARALVAEPGRLASGSPVPYAWGIRVGERHGQLMHSHGGSWPGWVAKTIRLPGAGISLAALSNSADGERIHQLSLHIVDHCLDRCPAVSCPARQV